MKKIFQMQLAQSMALVFGLLGLIVTALAAFAGWEILSLRAQLASVPELMTLRAELDEWQAQTTLNAGRTVAILQSSDTGLAGRLGDAMKGSSERISVLQKKIEALPLDESERKLFAQIGEARKLYLPVRDELLKRKRENDPAAGALFEQRFMPALSAYTQAMEAFRADYAQRQGAELAAGLANATRTIAVLLGFGLAFLGIASVVSFALTRSITRPLARAVVLANSVADGDLTASIEASSRDETGLLLAALQRMSERLTELVGRVRSGTHAIAAASAELASGSHDLSQRTEEQASSLEETAASMEELTATVKQNADNARQANQLAASASAVAAKGGEVVGEVVTTMDAINRSSRKIADIIGVIDGIAFQTNILALNAAVEAARAGEQGRGFAVVAGEVRNLAQRSAAAAKEIKGLIADSLSTVDAGAKRVDDAGATMAEVVASIKRVTDIMAEITAASEEQSAGIGQVNEAVAQMDHVTQQNAALVEEAAAAAESMQTQAADLTKAVAAFKLDDDRAENIPVAVPPPLPSPSPEAKTWPAVERRSASRARNVTRLPLARGNAPSGGKTGTADDDWTQF